MHAETLSPSAALRSPRSERRGFSTASSPATTSSAYVSDGRTVGNSDFKFRKAVCRVLIALSFKSFRRRNERYRRRERSDCSDARILAVVEEERAYGSEDHDLVSVRDIVQFNPHVAARG